MSGADRLDGGPGRILAANHSSFFDPVPLIGTLHRLGHRPAVLATAALWRVPLLSRALTREGYVPVHRGSRRAPDALRHAADALTEGRSVLIHPEGGLPRHDASHDRPPGRLKSGVVRLALSSGAPVVPIGHAGARRVPSRSRAKPTGRLGHRPRPPPPRPRPHRPGPPAGRLAPAAGRPGDRPRRRLVVRGADAGSDSSSVTFAHPGGSGSRPGPNELS
ncbi:lysophospholipid acyltransferase family protein [Streptomyces diastatochromogenes]|uniref:lysophospholipid acyltransferase family protein n=1 Tax=Streptomyces diastatochromogenes TaxID=42236 RepID=UPI0036CEFE66